MANNAQKEEIGEESSGTLGKMRANPWIASTIFLSAILLIALIYRGPGMTGNVVSTDEAGKNLVDFAKAKGYSDAQVLSVTQEGALYNAVLKVNNQSVPVMITLDGNYLVDSVTPLSATAEDAAGADTAQTAQSSAKISDLDLSGDPTIGNKDAKVTVVEFSDFSCPYCAAVSGDNPAFNAYMKSRDSTWEPIVTNLIKDYVQTGKVKFIYKYTPGHSRGKPASLVSWCLNDQSSDLYWKFYSKAFASYDMNAQTQAVEDLAKMKDLARSIGADMTKLQACLDSGKFDSKFDKDQNDGIAVGVQGTPALFVNNNYVAHGAMSYTDFKKAVDAALAAA